MEERILVSVAVVLPILPSHKRSWHIIIETSPCGPAKAKIHIWHAYLSYLFLGFPTNPQGHNRRLGVILEEVACSINFKHHAPCCSLAIDVTIRYIKRGSHS